MRSERPKVIQDQWTLQLYTVSKDDYSSLDLQNRSFPYWIVSHVLSGKVKTTNGGQPSGVADSGSVMIHPPHVAFSETATVPGIHQWIAVEIKNKCQLDIFRMFPVSTIVRLENPSGYSRLFRKLLEVWNDPDLAYRDFSVSAYAMLLINQILESWRLLGAVPREPISMSAEDRFIGVIKYISAHLHEKITRKTLAHLLRLNPNYFDRLFAEAYGMSPMRMLRELRLNHAKQMLETGEDTLSTIAKECGLGDAAHLSRQFHRVYGITPGKYREQARKAQENYMRQEDENH